MQFIKSLVALSSLLAATSAYQVLTPTLNSTLTKGNTVDVTWTSVDTDASTFSIYLVNFATAHYPPTVLSLVQNVPQAAGSLAVRIPCDVSSDYGWQLNFINGTNTYVIYAQSSPFTLTGDCVDPTTSSSIAVSTTTATVISNSTITINSTATVTATTTAVATVVQTIDVGANPMVWFVQPSTGAMCAPAATVTVSVFADGDKVTCGSGSYPTTVSAPSYPGGNFTLTSVTPKTTSASTVSTGPAKTTAPTAVFTGAASSVQAGSAIFGLAALVAFFL